MEEHQRTCPSSVLSRARARTPYEKSWRSLHPIAQPNELAASPSLLLSLGVNTRAALFLLFMFLGGGGLLRAARRIDVKR